MLAHDKLGSLREQFNDPLPLKYYQAFEKIIKDPNQELVVLESHHGEELLERFSYRLFNT